jgi:hypothetical protein
VVVNVGKDETVFNVYNDILCHSSPFFRAALTGSFAEATSSEVKLETVSVGTFGLFVDWLYTRRENPEMENALLSPTKNNYLHENVIDSGFTLLIMLP